MREEGYRISVHTLYEYAEVCVVGSFFFFFVCACVWLHIRSTQVGWQQSSSDDDFVGHRTRWMTHTHYTSSEQSPVVVSQFASLTFDQLYRLFLLCIVHFFLFVKQFESSATADWLLFFAPNLISSEFAFAIYLIALHDCWPHLCSRLNYWTSIWIQHPLDSHRQRIWFVPAPAWLRHRRVADLGCTMAHLQ